jgi:plasmid stabilization system protein ParE
VTLDFLQAAEADFTESIAYYEQQQYGLGMKFATEVKRTLSRIMNFPTAWTPLSPNTRRCRLNRFPYAVLYQLRSEAILIVAIQNLHQDPVSWKARLSVP